MDNETIKDTTTKDPAEITPSNESTTSVTPTEPEKTPREKIYEQYYGDQVATPPIVTPAEETPVDAGVGKDSVSNSPAEPVVTPSVATADKDTITQKLAEMEAVVEAQKRELEQLKTSGQSMAEGISQEEKQGWIDLYREGKFEEGDHALAKRMEELTAQRRSQEAQTLMVQTVEMLEAKNKIQRFTDEVKQKNPHLKNLEGVFNSAIERDLVRAKEEGKIKSHKDFADFYTERLKTYVDSANAIVQESRATGAKIATTRTEEVIANSVVRPQDVSAPHDGSEVKETKPELPADPLQAYIALRRAQAAKRNGMAT